MIMFIKHFIDVLIFFALWFFSGIAAGIYTTNSPEACQHSAEISRANIIVVEDEQQLKKIMQIRANLPLVKAIIQFSGTPSDSSILSVCDNITLIKFILYMIFSGSKL